MNVHLVTGGTGFLGKYLVEKLVNDGECVWVLLRDSKLATFAERGEELFGTLQTQYPERLRFVQGDVMRGDLAINRSIREELKNHTVYLWHLAACLSFSAKDKKKVLLTNFAGTKNIVNFANKYAYRYLHVSTAYVCGSFKDIFYETDLKKDQEFRNNYELSKYQGEHFVHDNCRKEYVIFRPSVILGDAYRGKAEGCTFGYYRFAYMFYIFKHWLISHLERGTLLGKIIKALGSSYDSDRDILTVPWFYLPCPSQGEANLIPVDYVVLAMSRVWKNSKSGTVFHLTHPRPAKYKMIIESVLDDLGYRSAKCFRVPVWFFVGVLNLGYFLFKSIRPYIISAKWYVPYFSKSYNFDRTNVKNSNLPEPQEIDREFVREVNKNAKRDVFDVVENCQL